LKVLLINGQNHKGSTYHLGRMLAEKLSPAEDIEEIFLPRDLPQFCCGCGTCFMDDEKKCPHYKYVAPLTEKLDAADVLIFATPVYVYHATGSMKAFLDHYAYRWMLHRPEESMFSKQAVVLTTCAGAGIRTTCRDVADSCFFWGIPKIYTWGEPVFAARWEDVKPMRKRMMERKTDELAKTIRKNEGKVEPGVRTRGFFAVARMIHHFNWTKSDVEYWHEKGWDKKTRPWG
jgi:multimeric flavodoxin WrbA